MGFAVPDVVAVDTIELQSDSIRGKMGVHVGLGLLFLEHMRGCRLVDQVEIFVLLDLPAMRMSVKISFGVLVGECDFEKLFDIEETASHTGRSVMSEKKDRFVRMLGQNFVDPFDLFLSEDSRNIRRIERIEKKKVGVWSIDDPDVSLFEKRG